MIGSVTALAASVVFLVIAFVPLERAFAARRQHILRSSLATDAAFLVGQYLLWNGLSVALLRAGSGLAHTWLAPVWAATSTWPVLVLALVSILGGDLVVYWFHRACHHHAFLWRFHAVHHTSEELDWVAAHREHPVDGVLTMLAQNLPAILLGLPMQAIAGVVAFRGVWAIFVHANVRVPLGPLGFLLGSPQHHHFHHANLGAQTYNFANLAPWIDRVFGTYRHPPATYTLGIDEAHPRGYFLQIVAPFLTPAARARLAAWEEGESGLSSGASSTVRTTEPV